MGGATVLAVLTGAIFALQSHAVLLDAGVPASFWPLFAAQSVPWLVWVALLYAILQLPVWWPSCPGVARFVVLNSAIGLVVGELHFAVSRGILALLGAAAVPVATGFPPGSAHWSLGQLAGDLMIYWLLVGLVYVAHYQHVLDDERLQSAQLTAKVATAELTALRAQLCPHFLFNTLNSACALMPSDPERAEVMIAKLSQLLRLALQTDGIHEVPLVKELEFARAYLDVERIRFQERLRVTIDVEPDVRDAMVPNFLLQPLVENAVHHAVAPSREPRQLDLVVWRRDAALVIEVRDDGAGLPGGTFERRRGAIGLSTTRARLEHLYGEHFHLEVRNREGGGAVTEVVLPLHLAARQPAEAAA